MGTRIKYICAHCGLEIIRYKSLLRPQQTIYCSRKCFANARRLTSVPWNKGRINVYSEKTLGIMSLKKLGTKPNTQTRLKMSKAHSGCKSSFWKGGTNTLNVRLRKSIKNILWKEQILKRDNYTCQYCGIYGVQFHIHHKIAFSILLNNFLKKYDFKHNDILFSLAQRHIPFWDIGNGITLCIKCHKKTSSYLKCE